MHMKDAVSEIYKYREDYIIIGLTGMTGSGASTVASVLTNNIQDISCNKNYSHEDLTNDQRSHNIIKKHADKKWSKFFSIKVRDIITSFMLDIEFSCLSKYIESNFNISIEDLHDAFHKAQDVNKLIKKAEEKAWNEIDHNKLRFFIEYDLPKFSDEFKKNIATKNGNIISIYQKLGNDIRKFGLISHNEKKFSNVYSISIRINAIIKSLQKTNPGKNYFVIDSFKNPVEIKFFQERYSAFYLFAITCPPEDRIKRMSQNLRISPNDIETIDKQESPEDDILDNEKVFFQQNIKACIRSADIFINNPGFDGVEAHINSLGNKIIRYISLIEHPGIVPPSRDEFLMQLAFNAKLNSGCISRQVGAIVTNADGAPKAVGWNNSPEGQSPCIYRNVEDLLSRSDEKAFSKYEQNNQKLIEEATKFRNSLVKQTSDQGKNLSFCFKKFQNKIDNDKNQVHTRALHAEENAFLQITKYGNEGVKGGRLFTTSSPCVLCAKKAYQIGIVEIVYIEPYPDITLDHIIQSGEKNIKFTLFSGAIGSAYHKLYSPLVSYKDELYAYECHDTPPHTHSTQSSVPPHEENTPPIETEN